jgi:putative PIN family toxin of toxin-antitoxin system
MRVVLDTNILVSACWKPGGLEAQIVDLAISGQLTLCITPEIIAEYRDVLSRRKLASVNARALEILTALDRTAVSVTPTKPVAASIDDDDNRFLECAEAAGAEYLITGNLRHYPETWGATRIVNARVFLGIGAIPLQ